MKNNINNTITNNATANNTASTPSKTVMPKFSTNSPLSQIIEDVVKDYIKQHPVLPDSRTCTEDVVIAINQEIDAQNKVRQNSKKLTPLTELPLKSIAMLMASRNDIALVAPGDKSLTNRPLNLTKDEIMKLPIAIYQSAGYNEGIWELSNNPTGAFGVLVEEYKPNAMKNDKTEVFTFIKGLLRVVRKSVIPYLVPVNNGIFDVLNKKMLPFSPDCVFTSKIHTDLDPNAKNPVIPIPEDGSNWDVDSWFDSLGKPEFINSVKEVIQAACLPLAPRNKMCLFYSQTGNNGKGTICKLIRNLLGENTVASIPLKQFSEKFGLSNLPSAVAVIADENDVSSFSKGLSELKAAITGDPIKVEQKYQNPYKYTFNGLILQCVNALPKVADKTNSFHRRLHIIPFENCFTGVEKRYIKEHLIHRKDVLEYILKMVLIDMDYRDKFTETADTQNALNLYITLSNSVVAFLQEILPKCKWDLLPATDFLYEAYKNWYKQNIPSGKVIGRNEFLDGVRDFIRNDAGASAEWEWTDSTRPQGYIDCSVQEPLLTEYGLQAFQDDTYSMNSIQRQYACQSKLKVKYSGLKRRTVLAIPGTDDTDADTDTATH